MSDEEHSPYNLENIKNSKKKNLNNISKEKQILYYLIQKDLLKKKKNIFKSCLNLDLKSFIKEKNNLNLDKIYFSTLKKNEEIKYFQFYQTLLNDENPLFYIKFSKPTNIKNYEINTYLSLKNQAHLKSWQIYGLNENFEGELIDNSENIKELNGLNKKFKKDLNNENNFNYILFLFKKNWSNNNLLTICSFKINDKLFDINL